MTVYQVTQIVSPREINHRAKLSVAFHSPAPRYHRATVILFSEDKIAKTLGAKSPEQIYAHARVCRKKRRREKVAGAGH